MELLLSLCFTFLAGTSPNSADTKINLHFLRNYKQIQIICLAMHSHSTQIPFWSDEYTRNLNRMWRNKCCNNLKGGGKSTRHAELLFSNLPVCCGFLAFFFLKLLDLVSSVIPFSACWRMTWALVKREVYGFKSYSMDWSESSFVLRLCANHLPREFNYFFKNTALFLCFMHIE